MARLLPAPVQGWGWRGGAAGHCGIDSQGSRKASQQGAVARAPCHVGLGSLLPVLGRDIGKRLEVRRKVDACLGKANYISRLEHAQARLTLSYNRRGDLAIHLVSPMGTRSTLLAAR